MLRPRGFKGFPLVTVSGGYSLGFPDGSEVKASASNAGDPASIPGSGRSPGEGNGTPLQYSCLENPMDGEAWWATVHGVAESDTTERLHSLTPRCMQCMGFPLPWLPLRQSTGSGRTGSVGAGARA